MFHLPDPNFPISNYTPKPVIFLLHRFPRIPERCCSPQGEPLGGKGHTASPFRFLREFSPAVHIPLPFLSPLLSTLLLPALFWLLLHSNFCQSSKPRPVWSAHPDVPFCLSLAARDIYGTSTNYCSSSKPCPSAPCLWRASCSPWSSRRTQPTGDRHSVFATPEKPFSPL